MARVVAGLVAALFFFSCSSTSPPVPSSSSPTDVRSLAAVLEAVGREQAPPSDFEVEYDDLHPLHGGETIRVGADGVLHWVRVADQTKESGRVPLSSRDVAELARLLVSLEAWAQLVPERDPVPDESRAYLSLRAGGHHTAIWEWYNDLAANDRMGRVKAWLERFVHAN